MTVLLADAIARAEVEAVAAVLAKPADMMPVAEAEGVTAGSFDQYDLRLIWCAADVARHLPVVDVLHLARRALQADRYWDPKGPISYGCKWSDETLVRLATSYPACVAAVRYNARHLLALNRRREQAVRLLADLRDALTFTERPLDGGTDVVPIEPAADPVIVNAPIRRKRGAA
jgi:hypothetical protein